MNRTNLKRRAFAAAWIAITATVAAARTPDETQATTTTDAATVAAPPASSASAAPLIDENGQPYEVIVLEKRPDTFVRLGEKHVRIFGGYRLEILSENEKEFRLKRLLPTGEVAVRPAKPPAPDLAAIAKQFEVALPEVDRLRLEPFDRGLPRTGQWRNGFDLADLDGDGKLELLFGPARKGRPIPIVFRQDGAGSWSIDPSRRFPPGRYDYGDLKVADWNGDGALDLALGMHLLGVVALIDGGGGEYAAANPALETLPSPGEGGVFSSRALRVADWDRDGRPDLIALGDGPSAPTQAPSGAPAGSAGAATGQLAGSAAVGLVVYSNRPDGSWGRWRDPSPAAQRLFGDTLAVADLDRDGDLDVVVGARQLGRKLILGHQAADHSIEWRPLGGLRPGALVDGIEAADFDGDGWTDLAIGFRNREGVWRSGVDLFFGGADGFERIALLARESQEPITALASGDLDGDGRLDLIALPSAAEALLFLGQGGRAFARQPVASTALAPPEEGCTGYAARVRDLDGDGRAEVVAAFAGDPAPTGPFGLPLPPTCTGGGSVRVWRTAATGER